MRTELPVPALNDLEWMTAKGYGVRHYPYAGRVEILDPDGYCLEEGLSLDAIIALMRSREVTP